ncbi:MAG: outer membrane lipoprotein carrier protein LolA [Acidobacteriota bacterium]
MSRSCLTARRCRLAAVAVVALVPAVASLGAGPASPPVIASTAADINVPEAAKEERLHTILERFDEAQRDIRTLQADFAERKELSMLVDPIESTGRFYYENPDRAKWEYLSPDRRVFLISDNTLMQYLPAEKTLEKKDLRAAYTHRLFKVFGLGQTSEELMSYYDIHLGEDEPGSDTYLLVLVPHKRRVEKRLSRVLLWVGDHDFLPRAMEYQEADGDTTHLTFEHVRINDKLADGTFHLDVPEGVEIRKQISLFSDDADASR